MRRILITGTNGYLGINIKKWLQENSDYHVDTISLRDNLWKRKDMSKYDTVIHLAAIVHKKENKSMEDLYYKVNKDLTVNLAKLSKDAGVKQFIFMSTLAVYGEEGSIKRKVIITKDTEPNPKSFYGKSKLEAERELQNISDDKFPVAILRPPMIYGHNCPGNYKRLERLAQKTPIFPMIKNERSMLHIDKMCRIIYEIINTNSSGIFLPQDEEYVNTSLLVKKIAQKKGRTIILSKLLGNLTAIIGRNNRTVNKVFGSLIIKN